MSGDRAEVYLPRQYPCWLCSKPLMRATTGRNVGLFSGVVLEASGARHFVHESCADGYEQREALTAVLDAHADYAPLALTDDGTWRRRRLPQDQEWSE